MILAIIIFAISCLGGIAVALAKPQLKLRTVTINTYWLVPLLGALALIFCNLISVAEIFSGLTAAAAINPIKILVLFLSMTVMSIFLDELGFFRWLANAVLKKAGTSQLKVFAAFFIFVTLVAIPTDNDIVILTLTPFICYFTKAAGVNPIPYLISEFIAANTISMMLLIGNPTNVYLAVSNGIHFMEYLSVMWLPAILATVTAFAVLYLLFRKQLRKPIKPHVGHVEIKRKDLLIVSSTLLIISNVLLAIAHYIDIEMWLIASLSAVFMITVVLCLCAVRKKAPIELKGTFKRVPWELIPFILSMFVIVSTLAKYDVTSILGDALGSSNPILVYGVASVLFANLVNNIPMSVLFSTILLGVGSAVSANGVYATIIGSNIGAFLTPLGALAGIMWLSIIKTNGIDFSFGRFLRYGVIIAPPVLAAALLGLYIVTF